ncbi:Glycine N-methyltransferase [Eumeta japonica]|uniref:Glycine N-methyltransferase n=1 Tax=Eumeta variegata TaxID=151549 RepID=A0A4C1SMT4_EUMVA|nr:Glycine N-methyltransferase [Eumeta japonica]
MYACCVHAFVCVRVLVSVCEHGRACTCVHVCMIVCVFVSMSVCMRSYCRHPVDIKTSVLVVRGRPELVTLDYCIDIVDNNISEKKLARFTEMLDEVFDRSAVHRIYGDFRPLEEVSSPAFYIHVLQKQN